jgi:hypothetical protein
MTILSDDDRAQAQKILRTRYETSRIPDEMPTDVPKKKGERSPCFTRQDLQSRALNQNEWQDFERILRRDLDVDVPSWWERNRDRFLTFYRLACPLLPIPATSASSERQFSKAKRLKARKWWSGRPLKLGEMVVVAENRDVVRELLIARRTADNSSDRADTMQLSSDEKWTFV